MSGGLPPEIRMIRNIAVQFGHLPPERAAEEVANHVRRFWDPRMRARLLELANGGIDLDPVVRAAADLVRGEAPAAAAAVASEDLLVTVRTADGWFEVDLAGEQARRGICNALGIAELESGPGARAAIERVTAHWGTSEVLLALEQEDVRPTRSSADPGLVTP